MTLVTVLIVTYNHVGFIAAAIDSAFAQKTHFDVEIIISEDASTDGTRAIVEDYAARFPSRIRLMLSETNLRSNETVARGLRAARGEFVALLDGDDCWTATDKLQRQADFLLNNPDCAAHFFNARIIRGGAPTEGLWTPQTQARRVDLAQIWHGNPYATAAGMLRLAPIRDVPSWYHGFFPRTDWPLYILCAISGLLAFDPEPVALYRLHEGGMFSPQSEASKLDSTFAFLTSMDQRLGGQYHDMARAGCSGLFYDWAEDYLSKGQPQLSRQAYAFALRGGGVGQTVRWGAFGRLGLRLAKASVLQ
ncbi:glycosyltransferase [Devosia neptuniae]|uniref:Glycosyltransferase n=1 Tax=Devosia neptuniae TaxID=191302 RepID=A0ABY6CAI6_9HYPH|nr:glycosyltransferase [Devosia neptuniae]UXN69264.1 glycosyltransferase [Devosia neptuniae]